MNKHVRQNLYTYLLIAGAYLAFVVTATTSSMLFKTYGITQLKYIVTIVLAEMLMVVIWTVTGSSGTKINTKNQISLEV